MFKKRVNISILICLIFVLFFATNSFVSGQAASQQAAPPPATGLVKVYIGDVQIAFGETASTAAPVFAKAQVNQELKAPTRIKTGKDSTIEILLQDKSVLKIGPGSDLLIETWNFDSQSKQKQGIFKLFTGKIMAFVSKLTGNSSFQIITNNGVASVRGTSFGVNVKEGPSGSLMDVLVFKGQVAVGPLGAIPSNFLNAGQMVSVAANSVLSTISDITSEALDEFNQTGTEGGMQDIESEPPEEENGTPAEGQQNEQTNQEQQTQTTELTGQEKQEAEQKVKSEFEKWLDKYLNFIGDFGSTVIDDQVWSTFTVDAEFDFGKIGFALYMPIIYGNDLFNPESWYNYESYHLTWGSFGEVLDSTGKILSIFRYFRINFPDDPFFLKFGQFDDFILGNGMNLYLYSNMYDFPYVRRLGVNMNLLFKGFGLNLAIDQLTKPGVVGIRPYFQFIKNVPLYLGFEFTGDLTPLYDETSIEPVYGSLATGLTFPIIQTQNFLTIIGFGDLSVNYVMNSNDAENPFYITNGYGIFAGLRGNILFINYRAEYRMLAGEYIPQIFSIDYYKKRSDYVSYFTTNTNPLDFSALSSLISGAKSGLFLEAQFDLFDKKITGYASWAHYFYQQTTSTLANDFLTAGVTLSDELLPPFEGTLELVKPDFLVEGVNFFENLSMKIILGYTVSEGFKIYVSYSIFYIPDISGNYLQQTSYSVMTQVSFF